MRFAFVYPVVVAAYCTSAHAVQYVTVEQAQKIIFPSATNFRSETFNISDQELEKICNDTDLSIKQKAFSAWLAEANGKTVGYFFVDNVIGKHEEITYAVGFSQDKKVLGVEIIEYRETHGFEVKEQGWRSQFVGKSASDKLKVGDDIQNISGATLSAIHVTEGVRKLAHLLEVKIAKA